MLVIRKSDDPAILVPVNKAGTSDKYKIENKKLVAIKRMEVANLSLLTEIAPADYRDASVKIISNTEKETRNKWEKIAPYLVFGMMAIIFMITIILIVQMVKQGQTQAKDLILEAGKIVANSGTKTIIATGGAP